MAPPSLNFVYGMLRAMQRQIDALEKGQPRILRLDDLMPASSDFTSQLNADASSFVPALTDCQFTSLVMHLLDEPPNTVGLPLTQIVDSENVDFEDPDCEFDGVGATSNFIAADTNTADPSSVSSLRRTKPCLLLVQRF